MFVIYTGVFITLLRKMILREDFGTGPLPDLPGKGEAHRRIQWRRLDDERRRRGFRAAAGSSEKPAKFVPGQPDMWVFVLFEALLFTGYFTVYLVSRTQNGNCFCSPRRTSTCASGSSTPSFCW